VTQVASSNTDGSVSKPLKEKKNVGGISYADKRREEKRAALREYLLGHTYLRDIHSDLSREITEDQLPVVKFKTETRLKLLAKCLPDLARTELTGEDGEPMKIMNIPLQVVGVKA
jgi:hypothetical protein